MSSYDNETYPIEQNELPSQDYDLFYNDRSRDYYLEGKTAMKSGLSIEECPYLSEDEKNSTLWMMGWQSGTIE